MKTRTPHNKLPASIRYVSKSLLIKLLNKEYPQIELQEIEAAIKVDIIKCRRKVYKYQRGYRRNKVDKKNQPVPLYVKQIDIRFCVGDALNWAKTKSEIQ